MGSDMLIAAVRMDVRDRDVLFGRIDALSDQVLEDIAVDFGRDEEASGESLQEYVREQLRDAVAMVGEDRRDLSWLHTDDETWALSGGPSWGDDPTDAYAPLTMLAWSGITLEERHPIPSAEFVLDGLRDRWIRYDDLPVAIRSRLRIEGEVESERSSA